MFLSPPNHWKAQRSFDSFLFFSSHLCLARRPRGALRGFKNAKPSLSRQLNFRDLWQREGKLFFCRGFWRPAWPTAAALAASPQNGGVTGGRREKGGWRGYVSMAKWRRANICGATLGGDPALHPPYSTTPYSPWHTSYSEKSGHVSIRLPTPTPHSVFRGTDLISGIIFQTGHRWEIKLKTWPCMGHKG